MQPQEGHWGTVMMASAASGDMKIWIQVLQFSCVKSKDLSISLRFLSLYFSHQHNGDIHI